MFLGKSLKENKSTEQDSKEIKILKVFNGDINQSNIDSLNLMPESPNQKPLIENSRENGFKNNHEKIIQISHNSEASILNGNQKNIKSKDGNSGIFIFHSKKIEDINPKMNKSIDSINSQERRNSPNINNNFPISKKKRRIIRPISIQLKKNNSPKTPLIENNINETDQDKKNLLKPFGNFDSFSNENVVPNSIQSSSPRYPTTPNPSILINSYNEDDSWLNNFSSKKILLNLKETEELESLKSAKRNTDTSEIDLMLDDPASLIKTKKLEKIPIPKEIQDISPGTSFTRSNVFSTPSIFSFENNKLKSEGESRFDKYDPRQEKSIRTKSPSLIKKRNSKILPSSSKFSPNNLQLTPLLPINQKKSKKKISSTNAISTPTLNTSSQLNTPLIQKSNFIKQNSPKNTIANSPINVATDVITDATVNTSNSASNLSQTIANSFIPQISSPLVNSVQKIKKIGTKTKDNANRNSVIEIQNLGKRKRSTSPINEKLLKRFKGDKIKISGSHISKYELQKLMQKQMREDRLHREQSSFQYTVQELKSMQRSKDEINSKLAIEITNMLPIEGGVKPISSVAIFGHLGALFGSHIPTSDEVIRFEACLNAIEAITTPIRVPRIHHKYFIDLDDFRTDLRLPGFISDLTNIGIQVESCFKNGLKETYTKRMLSEICIHAASNPNILLILVFKELKPFSSMLYRLKALKIPLILLVPTRTIDLVEYEIMCNSSIYFFDVSELFIRNPRTLIGYDPHRISIPGKEIIQIKDLEDEIIIVDSPENEKEIQIENSNSHQETPTLEHSI